MASKSTVTACFRNRFDASAAYDYAMGKGYTRDEVNVMMSNSTREAYDKEGKHPVGSMATEGVAAGGAIGAGAVTGGLLGGLIGLGIPESNAAAYEAALKEGGVVIGVQCRSSEDCSDIKKRFEEFKGENIVTV